MDNNINEQQNECKFELLGENINNMNENINNMDENINIIDINQSSEVNHINDINGINGINDINGINNTSNINDINNLNDINNTYVESQKPNKSEFDNEYMLMLSNIELTLESLKSYDNNIMNSLFLGFLVGILYSNEIEIETIKLKTVLLYLLN